MDVRLDSACARCGEPHGKPRVAHPGAPEVSISHAGDRVLVAVSMAGPVGVDVEAAESKADVSELAPTSSRRPSRHTCTAWCRQPDRPHSCATGRGRRHSSKPPDWAWHSIPRASRSPRADEPARLLSSAAGVRPGIRVTMNDLTIPDGSDDYLAAAAILRPAPNHADVIFRCCAATQQILRAFPSTLALQASLTRPDGRRCALKSRHRRSDDDHSRRTEQATHNHRNARTS